MYLYGKEKLEQVAALLDNNLWVTNKVLKGTTGYDCELEAWTKGTKR